MQQLWNRLETFLQENHPKILQDLAPPATDTQLAELEKNIGVKLSDDFIACLKIHNGQLGRADGLFDGSEFLSTSRIFQEWEIMKDIFDSEPFYDLNPDDLSNNGVKGGAWIPKWIPIISFGNGDIWCLDLDPGEGGNIGQVIQYWHEDITGEKEADSFTEWFSNFIDQQIDG